MAGEKQNKLFRQTALEKVSSPEQLNDYIKVTNPSIWVILAAAFALLGSAIFWACTGSIPTYLSATGISDGEAVYCFVPIEDSKKFEVGKEHKVDITLTEGEVVSGTVVQESSMYYSKNEASQILKYDYLIDTLTSNYNVLIKISPDKPIESDSICMLKIILKEEKPISFVFNTKGED